MEISAGLVKTLRERTGSGLMECKKTLVETNGDIDAAIELMRQSGLAKADKKASRTAADGLIMLSVSADAKCGAIVEINSETDFVVKGDDFQVFAQQVIDRVLKSKPSSVEALLELPISDDAETSVNTARKELIAKIGEKIDVRRFVLYEASDGTIGGYLHGGRIGVLVEARNADPALVKDIAMHVAASNPSAVSEADMSVDVIAAEKKIYTAQAAESGKPEDIVEKMVNGRVRKYLAENTLLGQPFVKDPDTSVAKLLKGAGATVLRFQRFEVGEGIEKQEDNFAEEVMAQARGN